MRNERWFEIILNSQFTNMNEMITLNEVNNKG